MGAFAAISVLFVVVMIGTTLPTPLYVFWQRQYSFGSAVTTVVFATYAFGVLAALLTAGQASDEAGRRPVLGVALALSLLASAGFAAADSIAVLLAARFVSGLAAGLTTAAATASLRELAGRGHPEAAAVVPGAVNLFGLGFGPLLAGVLAELIPAYPTTVPFEVHTVLIACASLALIPPDTVTPRPKPTWVRRPRMAVPSHSGWTFWAAALAGLISFALLGLFTSVIPSFLGETLHEHHPAVVGAVVFALFVSAVAAQILCRRVDRGKAVRSGLLLLPVALALIVAGLYAASFAVFLVGTVAAGGAVGAIFLGSLDTALSVAAPDQRGQVGSAYFTSAYVGLTIPVIGVGFAAQAFGARSSVLVAAVVLAIAALLAFTRLPHSADR
jgi:MFS family permease